MSHFKARRYSLSPVFTQAALTSRRYTLVLLNNSDVAAMTALQIRTGPDQVVPRNSNFYRTHFATGHTAIGFVDTNATLIAHALIRTNDDTTMILNMLVDPLHRGQQLQIQMIQQWLEAATQSGIKTATARIRTGNDVSLRNFDMGGLTICATEPSPEEPHAMTHVMKKSLQETTVRNIDFRPSV